MLSIRDASTAADLREARTLFEEYAASLDHDLSFQGFQEELRTLPGKYARPERRLLLASWDEALAGCVALRSLESGTCELKRLYVRPAFRARKIGRALAEQVLREAREAGYRKMRLDTLPSMTPAITLYRRLGFHPIDSYRENPVAGAVFLELQLDGRDGER
ncbi:MAG TPA: GNAT family N-acetyltransferase [Gemmatimonadales bacterium]|nr:GNAT family N-acetyltransferase [Gemmatimonadales bacterium]